MRVHPRGKFGIPADRPENRQVQATSHPAVHLADVRAKPGLNPQELARIRSDRIGPKHERRIDRLQIGTAAGRARAV